MGQLTSGGSLVTGSNVVDASLSTSDLSAASIAALEPTCKTALLRPNFVGGTGTANIQALRASSNTTLHIGQVTLEREIVVNKVSFYANMDNTAGTMKVTLYSEDGQTQLFTFTTASIAASGVVTTSLASPVTLKAGVYYISILSISTANMLIDCFGNVGSGTDALINDVTGKAILNGTITVTADTVPTTIDPTAISDTTTTSHTLVVRLDN